MVTSKNFVEHKNEGIWQHLLREKQGQSAKCKMCNAELKTNDQSQEVKKMTASIKAEMAVFESSHKRGCCLEQVYNYLMSVPPTSVEAERAFSSAGVLCTRLRSRLGDDTLDTLCFSRSYYQGSKPSVKQKKA